MGRPSAPAGGARLVPVLLLASGCAMVSPPRPAPITASDFTPAEVRRPAVFVRIALGQGAFTEPERSALPRDYEGALLEGLNARAVLVRDLRVAGPGEASVGPAAALARARQAGADHAILVDLRVEREVIVACRETGRPVRGPATVLRQDVEILRVADGTTRLRGPDGPGLTVMDVEVDCDNPRQSRRRGLAETVAEAVERLLARVVGP